jgi:hypothetical protein
MKIEKNHFKTIYKIKNWKLKKLDFKYKKV